GLSFFAYPFWWIGAPIGSSTNRLDIELRLEDKDENSLWTYDFSGEEWLVQGLYYNAGDDMTHMAGLMEQAMNAALNDLAPKLPEIAEKLRDQASPPSPSSTTNPVSP